MGYAVLCKHCEVVGSDQLRNTVVNLGIKMIRSSREDDSVNMVFLYIFKRFLTGTLYVFPCPCLFLPGSLGGKRYLINRDLGKLITESLGHSEKRSEGHERVTEFHLTARYGFDVILYVLGIGGDDRAVVVIRAAFYLVALIEDSGIEDEVDLVVYEP